MKWIFAAFLSLALAPFGEAQQPLGFVPDAAPGPQIKLDGLALFPVAEGYIAISVPPKDLTRMLRVASKLSLHMAALELLEHLARETEKIPLTELHTGEVSFGIVFLDSKEIFPRHKILDRFVEKDGTYTYTNRKGQNVTVPAYRSWSSPQQPGD